MPATTHSATEHNSYRSQECVVGKKCKITYVFPHSWFQNPGYGKYSPRRNGSANHVRGLIVAALDVEEPSSAEARSDEKAWKLFWLLFYILWGILGLLFVLLVIGKVHEIIQKRRTIAQDQDQASVEMDPVRASAQSASEIQPAETGGHRTARQGDPHDHDAPPPPETNIFRRLMKVRITTTEVPEEEEAQPPHQAANQHRSRSDDNPFGDNDTSSSASSTNPSPEFNGPPSYRSAV